MPPTEQEELELLELEKEKALSVAGVPPAKETKTPEPSSLSKFLRFVMGSSPMEQSRSLQFQYDALKNIPQIDGESVSDYNKRTGEILNPMMQEREKQIAGQGSIAQLEPLMVTGLTSAAANAPLYTAKMLAKFGILEKFSEMTGINKGIENIQNPEIRDSADIAKFIAQGAVASKSWKPALDFVKKVGPKAYTDELTRVANESVITKVQNALKPVQAIYSKITEPANNNVVSSQTYNQVLDAVPPSLRESFLKTYSIKTLNEKGNPQTTIGNIQKIELALKGLVDKQKQGISIDAESFDYASAAKKIKNIRISSYPEQIQTALSVLDSKYGPLISASESLIPKMQPSKEGPINTAFLFEQFRNPAKAGFRQYLRDLKKIGIDLKPEIKIMEGWVRRQKGKATAGKLSERAVEGAVLGNILKGGLGD